ncbi:hypothetical protein PHYBLDRAFT_153700 [Phycomyces blakesleeanus NRRL 1555(-)]|uniref:Uncharacterized protein n=1 Tax=Phycomyces blakesleeanus (strain ATCC 8743b / DSM 1359 / FGSC 10004 / NBRC 33097 / NRRL 1555) TaxID=763407 RepID=A0A162T0D5_PHYB8|nr:hypothetical protein PHYBLDRAFT_153700 [Phycomyces blakesleeanus NRRL 1555(-)]OAD65222.1 hypothetical protein PHYBLDRAFT_153700 [Phycomyces blakesleeanus NRRL 1555(-)]|eukprot:XP_018283262.1 hypothetical protein PHYBLDRAFT_153700 [Phycomyces blakesleeanus NRRL 1555(-)]
MKYRGPTLGLFRQSQAIKNRFPSRATGTPRLEEHMLIVFCMLLVPSVQVKHQGSDQSPWLSVSIPSRSSFKVQVKVHGFQYPIHPGQASMFRSPSYVSAIQVKCQGPDFPAMVIDVRRQGCDLPAKCSLIQVNQQDSDLPSMVIAIHVKRPGSDLPTMFTAIRVKRQGPDRPSMVIAIRVKRQEPDPPSMVTVINVKRQGPDRPSMVIVSSHPGQASRFRSTSYGYSTSVQPSRSSVKDPIARPWCSANHVKRPGSHLPAMVIDCSVIQVKHLGSDRQSMSPAIQVKHQGTTRPSMCWAIQVEHQGSDLPTMFTAIQVKCQGSDFPAMVKGSNLPAKVIVIQNKHHGSDSPSMVIVVQVKHQGSDLPAMSPAIQIKNQDSDLPAMSPAIQVERQGADLPFYGYSVESTKIMLHGSGFMSTHPRQLSGSDFHELL